MSYNGGHFGMGFPMIFIFLGLLFLIYLFVRSISSNNEPDKETPLDILKKRLAKGEITENEYDTMKKRLEAL